VPEPQPPLRVVLDANVFVASQWNPRSASARLLRSCERGELALCHSRSVRSEIEATLANTRAPQQFLARVRSLFASGLDVRKTTRVRAVRDDPEDDKYLECALAAGAAVVTNDRHLLQLGRYEDVEILRPVELEKRLLAARQ
jgi:putative PIN family toxin of toxin-antitoxin system